MSSKSSGKASVATAPIFDLPHDDQVDLLAQALLREYMHKKKFKATLEAFDEENPRNEKTVSQRSVMCELMYLSTEVQTGLKSRGIDTIMEMLCAGRVEKKARDARLKELREVIKMEVPTVPAEVIAAEAAAADGDAEKKKKKKKNINASDEDDDENKKKKKKKKTAPGEASAGEAVKEKKKKKKVLTIEDLLGDDDDANVGKLQVPAPAPTTKGSGVVLLGVTDIPTASTLPSAQAPSSSSAPRSGTTNQQEISGKPSTSVATPPAANDGSSSEDTSDEEEEEDYATALRRIRMQEEEEEQQHRRSRARSGADQDNVAVSSLPAKRGGWEGGAEETSGKDGSALGLAIASSSSPKGVPTANEVKHKLGSGTSSHHHHAPSAASSVSSTAVSHPTVGMDLARCLKLCLVGSDRRLPNSFLHQGFTFSKAVPYGLVQHEGGPCGVLAAVQSFALAVFIKSKFTESVDVQRSALLHGVMTILLLAAGNDVRDVVVCDSEPFPPKNSERNFASDHIKHMSSMTRRHGFASVADLEDYIATLVGSHNHSGWSQPDGPGLMCFIASMLLTKGGVGRGVADPQEVGRNICQDMDLEGPLIVEHGYCSQELVNLAIQGRATSNVHDGDLVADGGITLGGLHGPLQVGYLSFLEHRGLIKVGQIAKQPVSPVWIIYHESHYTSLFMKTDVRIVGGSATPRIFDLYFWDQQGQQDEEIRLTITLEEMPLPAVPKNALVPYLNDIVRTVPEWALARINWNGTDPLL